jgi:hypothetical protein
VRARRLALRAATAQAAAAAALAALAPAAAANTTAAAPPADLPKVKTYLQWKSGDDTSAQFYYIRIADPERWPGAPAPATRERAGDVRLDAPAPDDFIPFPAAVYNHLLPEAVRQNVAPALDLLWAAPSVARVHPLLCFCLCLCLCLRFSVCCSALSYPVLCWCFGGSAGHAGRSVFCHFGSGAAGHPDRGQARGGRSRAEGR